MYNVVIQILKMHQRFDFHTRKAPTSGTYWHDRCSSTSKKPIQIQHAVPCWVIRSTGL